MIYIFWTCSGPEEATKVIHGLLENRLIACGSILSDVRSIYRWEGKIEESKEVKVILKTLSPLFQRVEGFIRAHCQYEVPEIVQIEASAVSKPYLDWITRETSSCSKSL